MMIRTPELLVEYKRDSLLEQEHYGYIIVADKEHIIDSKGDSANYPFFLRSCAKPLQASLLIDYGMDIRYNMTEQEIALCCGSHAGESIHINIAQTLLEKIGINENQLKCGIHKPLSKTEQTRMLLAGEHARTLHNNCSGKHIFMLGLCKMNGWDLETYDDINHPLQQAIKKKIYDLCELKKEYPITKDGCGVPIHSMPIFNMVKGYLNLFTNPRYKKIKNAFLNNPYIIGGEDRTDTKIIANSKNLIAKTGAGGLFIVVNTETEEGLGVKICDSDMKARELVVTDSLNNLHWADIEADHSIKTLHGNVVGKIITLL